MRRIWMSVIALVASGSVAVAGELPDVFATSEPGCARFSPDGSMGIEVTIERVDGNPHAHADVRAIVSGACHDDLLECPLPGAPPLVFAGVTDDEGRVRFDLEIGGCCDEPASLVIETDPGAVAVLVFDEIGSPDQDGDLEVQLDDFVTFQAAFLSADDCADLVGCDDEVELADFVAFQSRFLATCP